MPVHKDKSRIALSPAQLVAAIKADTSVPLEVKEILDALVPQDESPPELTVWVDRVMKICKAKEIPDHKSREWIIAYATNRNYSASQIRYVLSNYKLNRRYNRYQDEEIDDVSNYQQLEKPIKYINRLKSISEGLSNLSRHQITEADSPRKVAELGENRLRAITKRATTAELDAYYEWIRVLEALLTRLKSLVEERKQVLKHETYGR